MLRSIRINGPLRLGGHRSFTLPPTYKPNSRVVPELSLARRFEIWWKSLQPGRLRELQRLLVEKLFSPDNEENRNVSVAYKSVPINSKGDTLNEVCFDVVNNPSFATKHIAFLHGYGASLGCFARNFQIVNQLKGLKHNYSVHFLDNVSFALSSNPKISSINHWMPIPRVPHLTLDDPEPTKKGKLYKKYYKKIKGYLVDWGKFKRYQQSLAPVLQDMEDYYLGAIDQWRQESGIEKIDFLVGHSFGGYWSGSYALKNEGKVLNLVLLSPVGVERTAAAVTMPIDESKQNEVTKYVPSLDPTSYNFLSRFPMLSRLVINRWYYLQPYLPRLLRFMGPVGVSKYYNMWYGKLYAINRVIERLGGKSVFTSKNQLQFGTNSECQLLIEYLYNSITSGTNSDIYVKYLLTPATTSKWPLYDKFQAADRKTLALMKTHFVYGQYDFMFLEAGEKLASQLKHDAGGSVHAEFHIVPEGGHNLYIQNPFGTNELVTRLVRAED